jgi:hypothetical protein
MGGVIVVFICVIGAIIWGIRAGKKRRDAMTLLAEKLGLRFNHERNYQIADRFSFLDKLRQGSNRYAFNVLEGRYQEHDITAFDYHYETQSTDSDGDRDTDHHEFSFFILTLPKYFEELTIAKESFFSKIAQAVGYDDIDFESHEFSKKFVVRSKNKKFAYDFCNAQMIEYLLEHPNINIEVDQNMLAIGYNNCLKVAEVESHLNRLIEIRELMPDYLFSE